MDKANGWTMTKFICSKCGERRDRIGSAMLPSSAGQRRVCADCIPPNIKAKRVAANAKKHSKL